MVSREQVNTMAAAIMSVAASISVIVVGPFVQTLSLGEKALAILVCSPGFFMIYALCRRVFDAIRYAPLMGSWYYITVPDPDEQTGEPSEDVIKAGVDRLGFGHMKFAPSGADWDYEVLLFPSPEAVLSHMKDRTEQGKSHGNAVSEAFRFDHRKKKINILYHATYHNRAQPDRYGRLYLNVVNSKRLRGRWTSDVGKTVLASGQMVAFRKKEFPEIYESITGHQLDA